MKNKGFKNLYKDFGGKGIIILLVLVFLIGGIGSVFWQRVIFPLTSNLPVLRDLALIRPDAPIVITRREEVRIVEGINQAEVVGRVKPALVSVYRHAGEFDSGDFRILETVSGAIATADGLVLTPLTPPRRGETLTVVTADHGSFSAEFEAFDFLTGLAILKIEGENLPIVKTGQSAELLTGQRLIAVWAGENPVRPGSEPVNLLFPGVVRPGLVTTYSLQALNPSLRINSGFSEGRRGAALVDKDGTLMGLISQIGGNPHILRSEDVSRLLDNFFADGVIRRTQLNLSYQVIADTQSGLFQLPKRYGVLLKSGTGSLLPDDFIFEIDGVELSEKTGFQDLLFGKRPGSTVKFMLIRDGVEREVEVKL